MRPEAVLRASAAGGSWGLAGLGTQSAASSVAAAESVAAGPAGYLEYCLPPAQAAPFGQVVPSEQPSGPWNCPGWEDAAACAVAA